MMSWGFWLLFAVGLCALAEGGMRIESWWRRRRRGRGIKAQLAPASRAREAAAARKLGRGR
jgi:biopolymer transport protein ExbB/TolQ